MNKEQIREQIIKLRAQMDDIANKDYQTSNDLIIYKNLNAQVDALFVQLFNK